MSLLKERLELKKKLEGKLTDSTPIKKEQKSVSKLVIPQKFTSTLNISNNPEEKSKSLNSSFSKSTGNLLNITRKFSVKSNSIQIEDKPEVERKLSSKSFNSPSEVIAFDDVKLNSRPKSFVENSTRSSNTFVFSDSSSQTSDADIPIIVATIHKNSLPDNATPPAELSNIFNFVRSPKLLKKEGTPTTVLHFNFAAKPDELAKQEISENLLKTPGLNRSVIADEKNVDVPKEDSKKTENENNDSTNSNMKKSDVKDVMDVKEEEIYVNIDIIRQYYNNATRIKCGPIKKNPLPSIRISLIN